MTLTRREFIKSVGVAIAALVLARCVPWPQGDDSARGRLRDCWLRFDWLAEETRQTWDGGEYDGPREQLLQEHNAALDELVAAGELTRAVADEIAVGFGAAVNHVWRSNVPITCYEPMMVDYQPTSAAQLVEQSAILQDLAASGGLDPATAAAAQRAIERDMAFLSLPAAEVQSLYERLTAGGYSSIPAFDQLELEITPEAAAAARYIVELLLKK